MNVKLLRKVKRHILAEPKRLDMSDWVRSVSPDQLNAPKCGTVACIAGWAAALTNPKLSADDLAYQADESEVNGLDLDEDQSMSLFHTENWPCEFVKAYRDAYGDAKKRAQIAAARIEHFIKTKGAE